MKPSIPPINQPLSPEAKGTLSTIRALIIEKLQPILKDEELTSTLAKTRLLRILTKTTEQFADAVLTQIQELQKNPKHPVDEFKQAIQAFYNKGSMLSTYPEMVKIPYTANGGRSFGRSIHDMLIECIQLCPINNYNEESKSYLDPIDNARLDSPDIALTNGYVYSLNSIRQTLNQLLPFDNKDIFKELFESPLRPSYNISTHSCLQILAKLMRQKESLSFNLQTPLMLFRNSKTDYHLFLVSEKHKNQFTQGKAANTYLSYERLDWYDYLISLGFSIATVVSIDQKLDRLKLENHELNDVLTSFQSERHDHDNLDVILENLEQHLNRVETDNVDFAQSSPSETSYITSSSSSESSSFLPVNKENPLQAFEAIYPGIVNTFNITIANDSQYNTAQHLTDLVETLETLNKLNLRGAYQIFDLSTLMRAPKDIWQDCVTLQQQWDDLLIKLARYPNFGHLENQSTIFDLLANTKGKQPAFTIQESLDYLTQAINKKHKLLHSKTIRPLINIKREDFFPTSRLDILNALNTLHQLSREIYNLDDNSKEKEQLIEKRFPSKHNCLDYFIEKFKCESLTALVDTAQRIAEGTKDETKCCEFRNDKNALKDFINANKENFMPGHASRHQKPAYNHHGPQHRKENTYAQLSENKTSRTIPHHKSRHPQSTHNHHRTLHSRHSTKIAATSFFNTNQYKGFLKELKKCVTSTLNAKKLP